MPFKVRLHIDKIKMCFHVKQSISYYQIQIGGASHPLLRVDLYEANDRVYFGEMTFYPDSGFDTDILPSTDMDFGSRLVL